MIVTMYLFKTMNDSKVFISNIEAQTIRRNIREFFS